jgi:hypothetical protein
MMWTGNVAGMGEDRGVYKVLVGKPEGKETHRTQRRMWKNGISMYVAISAT